MWVKYNFVCNNCDALLEITAQAEMKIMPDCLCGIHHDMTWIGSEVLTPA